MSEAVFRRESAVEYFKELVEGALAHQGINVGELTIKPRQPQEPNLSIEAEFVATTFVMQEGKAPGAGRGGRIVPKQPAVK